MDKILYATDLDRTLIFSYRFLEEYPSDAEKVLVERIDGKDFSYMSAEVVRQLRKIEDNIIFVPVTSRSIAEYNRIDLPIKPEYAIIANGGIIFHNGKPMKDWEAYKQKNMPPNYRMDILDISMDLQSSKALARQPKVIDNCYIMFKINDKAQWEAEELHYFGKYTNWDFGMQGHKVYAIPKHFSKQVALRWLQKRLDSPYTVASGDGTVDVPMMSLANKAVIPSHAELLKEDLVTTTRIAEGGIESPLYTLSLIKDRLGIK